MVTSTGETRRTLVGTGGLVLFLAAAVGAGCGVNRDPLTAVADEPAPVETPRSEVPPEGKQVFFDDFDSGDMPRWEPFAGHWEGSEPDREIRAYAARPREFALTLAGPTAWSNYQLDAEVTIRDDRPGQVGVVARAQRSHHYFELVLGRDKGGRGWSIRQRVDHRWTVLASGPLHYPLEQPLVLRFLLRGAELQGKVSLDRGRSFIDLGSAFVPAEAWRHGKFGLVSYGGEARFDNVGVTAGEVLALEAPPWGAVVELRDNTTTFPNRPSGGWYVTPIHANVRASDGRVLITGFGRRAEANCSGSTQREVGETWLLDPAQIDALSDGQTLFVTPINEANLDSARHVLYCAGHNTLADGRVFFSAGTDYPNVLPDSSPERGLTYSRVFNPITGTFTRISAAMNGGQSVTRGEKWYPSNMLLPDGRALIFGGFHWSGGGPGTKGNYSLEVFDPKIWDANPSANPYTVLTQHEDGASDTPPTRGYSNLLLLPRPVPAGSANGFARSTILMGGAGKVYLFNHEPGPTGAQRLFARPNAVSPNPSATEKGEGASSVMLADGTILFNNGGHDGQGAQRVYFYNPHSDSWTTLNTGISRMYGNAVALPDGQVLIMNGYQGPAGSSGGPEPGNTGDISNPVGDIRQPTLIDPYATPRTSTNLGAWPEPTHRGYHNFAALLKDGRILIGGGKDADHATGCEKNEMRIWDPPYLAAGGTRPAISSPAEGSTMTVGGPSITIAYSGTLRATRAVALMAPAAITHAFDQNQRYVPLTVVSGGGGSGSVTVSPPSNINIAVPTDYMLFLISDTGKPSVGRHVRLLPPAACVYAVNGGDAYIEAESRSRGDGPFTLQTNAGRSGGAFMQVTEGSGGHTTVPDEGKVLWYDLNVTAAGNYFVWALANGPDTSSDTMWVSLDGNADQQLTLPTPVNTWGWVKLSTTALNMPAGAHTLKVKVREDGALIDKLLLTQSSTLTPSGITNPALICNQPAPPPAPGGLVANPGNNQVSLMWNTAPTATSYTLKRGTQSGGPYTPVPGATNIAGTSFTDNGVTNGITYFYVVSASNAGGEGPSSGEVPATPSAPPAGWVSAPIPGTLTPAGSFSQMGSTFSLSGSGADIWGAGDQFRFAYQTLVGDGSITARVASLCGGTPGSCPNVWTKVGVMMRDGTATGARNVAAILSPTAANKYRFQRRTATGGTTTATASTPDSQVPAYLRLTRSGNTFSAFFSTNGSTFTQIGTTQAITLPGSLLVGLAVTSHTPGTLAAATFDSVVITTPTPPPAPANLVCVSGVGQCQLTWNASSGATSYTVKRSTTSGSGHTNVQTGITGTSFTDTTAAVGVTHFYVVTAVSGSGESGNSNQDDCTPSLPPIPPPPTNLVATPGNKTVGLTWSAASGATSYTVKRGTSMGGPFTPLTPSPTVTSFTDTTVVNGTAYFYVVTASNAGGESGNSSVAPATPSLTAPTGLTATPGNGQVSLSWTAVANATGYIVERSETSGGPYDPLSPNPTSPSFVDAPLTNGVTYFYVVSATSPGHEGPSSTQVSATPTPSTGPAPPSNLSATITGGNQANLTWADNSSNETGFRVERKVGAGAYATLANKAAGVTSHADPNLTPNTYTYRVIATGAPDSAPSSEVVVILGSPLADAYVRSGTSAGTNFGTATVLDVKHTSTTTTRRNGFLRFSLSGVAATVTSAKLRLYGNAATTAKATNVHPVADITWGETTITWNTPTTDAGGPAMGPTPLATQTVATTAAYVEWDVTTYVQQQKTAGATAVTLGVKSGVLSDEGQTTFHSKEGTNKPTLVISSKP
jgi:fibronectin type 3 domain-containing protein